MPLRFVPQIEGLEDNYIEIAEEWTRGETRDLAQNNEEATILKYVSTKVLACRLNRPGQDAFEGTGSELAADGVLDTLDLRLLEFVGSVLLQAAAALRNLGNLSGRLQSSGTGNKPK